MFPFGRGDLPNRSPCLQSFHKRRKKRAEKFENIYEPQDENFPPLIEEIDGVQFYRTTVPVVCDAVKRKSSVPKQKVRRSLKITAQPTTTIVVPEMRLKQTSRTKKSHNLFETEDLDDCMVKDVASEDKNKERRHKILEKLENGKENPLSRTEEEEIHERASFYSMSIKPDLKYLSLPEDFSHRDDPAYVASMLGQQLEYPLPKKRKSRNLYTDSCYVSYHTPDDPYDNSQLLPCGTRLHRPRDKLVELVADAITGSPDGLLQVPQIYTALMNKYPYFRYMDKSAVSSWRSSVRHALFQKWFRKVKFTNAEFTSKGCFWCINSQADSAEIRNVRNKKDCDLDLDIHDTVIALLNEEDQLSCFPDNFMEDMVKVPVYHFQPSGDNSVNIDPVLTTSSTRTKGNNGSFNDKSAIIQVSTPKNAILPVSSFHSSSISPSFTNSGSSSSYSDSSNDSSSLVSPLMHSIGPDTLGVDVQQTSSSSKINWAPTLPFDQFLERTNTPSQTSVFENEENVQPADYNFLDYESIVPSISPDLSSGKSTPDFYQKCQSGLELKEDEMLLCMDDNIFDSRMFFQPNDSSEICYIIQDGVKWDCTVAENMPDLIFDKDISSSPEFLSISPLSSPEKIF